MITDIISNYIWLRRQSLGFKVTSNDSRVTSPYIVLWYFLPEEEILKTNSSASQIIDDVNRINVYNMNLNYLPNRQREWK